jgi:hypothetical protein
MRTILIFHEVDDVDHWLESPRRREIFGPLGITARTFVDPDQSNRVGLLVEVPSMEVYREAIESPGAIAAMQYDGVRPGTVRMLIEG